MPVSNDEQPVVDPLAAELSPTAPIAPAVPDSALPVATEPKKSDEPENPLVAGLKQVEEERKIQQAARKSDG